MHMSLILLTRAQLLLSFSVACAEQILEVYDQTEKKQTMSSYHIQCFDAVGWVIWPVKICACDSSAL